MPDLQKVNESLEAAVQSLLELKKALNSESPTVVAQNIPPTEPQTQEEYNTFESLKNALNGDKWPAAVNPNLICDPNSAQDIEERARGIIELMIEEDLKGKKFLDYGCGDGSVVNLSREYNTALSVGYDIVHRTWKQVSGTMISSSFDDIKEQGPYDVILLFDVIDHLKTENPLQVLKKLKDILSPEGRIYMRCHPFTSRHATHLYHDLNKAYIHLVFSPEEIKQIIPQSNYEEHNIGVVYPIKTYTDYVAEAGLNVINRRDLTEKVENFFKIPKIAERIIRNIKFDNFPEFQMSLQFIDFVLSK